MLEFRAGLRIGDLLLLLLNRGSVDAIQECSQRGARIMSFFLSCNPNDIG